MPALTDTGFTVSPQANTESPSAVKKYSTVALRATRLPPHTQSVGLLAEI